MNTPDAQNPPEWINILMDRVKTLRFGSVELVVHQGRVTQVVATERIRIEPLESPKTSLQAKPERWTGATPKH